MGLGSGLGQNTPRTYNVGFPALRHWNVATSRKSLPIGLIRPALTCFSEMEYKNLNHLILIPLGLGATREGRRPTKVPVEVAQARCSGGS
jgi:hypothetical protein